MQKTRNFIFVIWFGKRWIKIVKVIEELNSLGKKRWQRKRKRSVVSTSTRHGQIGFTMSLKSCLNLCSFKWVNCSLKRDNTFTPRGSWTLYQEFSCFTLKIDFFNLYIDFAFLTSGLSLFYSSIQYGKNVFLKLFVCDRITFNFPADIDLKG